MTRVIPFLLISCLFIFLFPAPSLYAGEASFGGVGLQVVPTVNGELVVLNVLDNAPAMDKGLLPGDLIFQVDDFVLKGSEFGKVVSEHLWGPVGKSVELFYRRPGVAGARKVTVRRSKIDPRLTVTPTVQSSSLIGTGSN